MIKVGITGGIGSGKTYVADIFLHLGMPVYNSDEHTKRLYTTNLELKTLLIENFGSYIYRSNGDIDKDYLRKMVFSNSETRERINRIVHPFVMADFNRWCSNQKEVSYIIKESALLFETGLFRRLDKTILVKSTNELRIKRLSERDGFSVDEIKKRMSVQMTDAEKEKIADFVIINDEKKLLLPQVLTIHKQLLNIK